MSCFGLADFNAYHQYYSCIPNGRNQKNLPDECFGCNIIVEIRKEMGTFQVKIFYNCCPPFVEHIGVLLLI